MLPTPNTDRLCTVCGQTYTSDPGRVCSDCLPDAAAAAPGSITDEQRREIAALLLIRQPVADLAAINEFMTGVLGAGQWTPTSSLWALSHDQGAAVLEALEVERRGARLAGDSSRILDHARPYAGKRRTAGPSRRPSQGAHRARR